MNTLLREPWTPTHALATVVLLCQFIGTAVACAKAVEPVATNLAQTARAEVSRASGPGELLLNFRGAPIEMVLNHLSAAAGFIIQLNTPVHGTVDVWSKQLVTREEAVVLLNTVLNRNGYAAVRNGRLLTIMSVDDALHSDIPVRVSDDPESIAKTDEIMTLIIPVRFVEAEQLVKDLTPLVSAHANILANAAGNAIVVTDTQTNIRHLAEIIKAIDDSAEDMTELRVYHLKHHDPTEIAALLNNLFTDQSSSSSSAQAPFMFGGPGAPGFFGGNRRNGGNIASSGSSQSARIKQRARVVAVADPRTVSVVVSSSKDMAEQISGMITQLDQESPKVAHVSVIHLENADPQQVQQVLQDMFQSTTTTRSSTTQVSPLQNRIQQQNSSSSSSSSFGSSSSMGSLRSNSGLSSF